MALNSLENNPVLVDSIDASYDSTVTHIRIKKFIKNIFKKSTVEAVDIICIGCNNVIYDTVGPLIGTMVSEHNRNINIFGTLDNPINGRNVDEYIEYYKNNNRKTSIAIDACRSSKIASEGGEDDYGNIKLSSSKLYPAAAFGKQTDGIGDYSVKITTCLPTIEGYGAYSSISLSSIYAYAKLISSLIVDAYDECLEEEEDRKQRLLEERQSSGLTSPPKGKFIPICID